MRSLDANVPLRLLLRDSPAQHRIAVELVAEPWMLVNTVILEIVWVLRGKGWHRAGIADGLAALFALETVFIADRDAVDWALERFRLGGDFADLLHVALSGASRAFATFDAGVGGHAAGGPVPVETLVA